MKSLLSWFILLVSITLLVSSCASSDDSTTTASNESTSTTGDIDPTLVVVVETDNESAGSNCTYGGHKINTGYDSNEDGTLTGSEIKKTVYVCNGATGATGDNGSKGDTGATGGSGGSGSLPYFTGTPPTTAVQGTAYSFTPTITNTANDNISFSMLFKPSWMSVDNSTGVISGTPDGAAVGLTPTNLFYMLEGPKSINGRNFSVSVTAPEINATSISAGESHTCALDNSSGMVKCWGFGNTLGLGDTNNRGDSANEMGSNLGFVDLGTGRTATAISLGGSHTCALLDNASVKCWGEGSQGRLGYGNSNDLGDAANEMGDNLPIVDLGTGRTATAISAGQYHTCALLDNASVKCWGRNSSGRLGYGNSNDLGDAANEMGDNLPSIDLGTGRTATAISLGGSHTCALLDNASVKCWGEGSQGRLGYGNSNDLGDAANEMGDNLPIVDLGTGRTATAISAGSMYTCALLDNASVKCWGNSDSGQLGKGNTNALGDAANEMGDNLTIVDLGTGRTATAISAGNSHACAILDNASVKCWGNNYNGELGQGDTNYRGDAANEMGDNLSTVDLGTGRTATAMSLGSSHTCALLDNSDIKCWGDGNQGKLAQGNTSKISKNANEMGDNLPAIDL